MRRSRLPALPEAGGRRPYNDYSPRGAPHPRAAEWIFPWGDVKKSRENPFEPMPFWELGMRGSVLVPQGTHTYLVPMHRGSLRTLPDIPQTQHAQRIGEVGRKAENLVPSDFYFFFPARAEAVHRRWKRDGMGGDRWDPRAQGMGLKAALKACAEGRRAERDRFRDRSVCMWDTNPRAYGCPQ